MKLRNAKNTGVVALTLAAAVLTSVTTAQAAIATLTDGNSQAWVDVDSSAGMYQWQVDGINHLNQQWFWYRAGSGPQAPINTISPATWNQNDGPNKLYTLYANPSYGVEITYSLTGAGSGVADIDEGIKIFNHGSSPLAFTFYQYSDFNLLNTGGGDTVVMDATQAFQTKGTTQIAEGIIAPGASAFEANYVGIPGSTLDKLVNQPSLVLDGTGAAGPGDVTWSFQWDLVIPANSWEVITKDKLLNIYVVPEPSALAFVGLGFAALLFRWRVRGL